MILLRKSLVAGAILLLPSVMLRPLLRLLGCHVGPGSRIGFSVLWVDQLRMDANTRIGHLNVVRARRLLMRERSYLGRQNLVWGPISLVLDRTAALGNGNKVVRPQQGTVSVGPAQLRLGELAKITSGHMIDCCRSVYLGAFSTLAGAGSQIWTHSYVHDASGPGRYRIDGRVHIENNVYIGARCVINAGVRIAPAVIVGAGTTVARNLTEPGLYVAAGLRLLPRPERPEARADLLPCQDEQLTEVVYRKTTKSSDE